MRCEPKMYCKHLSADKALWLRHRTICSRPKLLNRAPASRHCPTHIHRPSCSSHDSGSSNHHDSSRSSSSSSSGNNPAESAGDPIQGTSFNLSSSLDSHTDSKSGSQPGASGSNPDLVSTSSSSVTGSIESISMGSSTDGSSRSAGLDDMAARLAQRFFYMQHPALANTRYSKTLLEFADAAVLAYECGYTQDALKAQLALPEGAAALLLQPLAPQPHMQHPSIGALATSSMDAGCSSISIGSSGGSSSGSNGGGGEAAAGKSSRPRYMVVERFDESEFLVCLGIAWITIMLSPKGLVQRWSTTAPVAAEQMGLWRGFVAHIVNSYFEKRMAWYPIERLQLELTALGLAAPHDVIAERARLCFTVLERVYPQFPSDN